MSFAWQRAHLQLLEERAHPIRTHEWRPPAQPEATRPCAPRSATLQRRARVRRWLTEDPARRLSERELAAQLEISRTAVQKHIRWLKAHEG